MADVNLEVLDLWDRPLAVGAIVAAAFRTGNVAELRIGKVLGFGERGNALTVRVQWYISSLNPKIDKIGEIEADLVRFVRID